MFEMFQLPFMTQAFIAAAITGVLLAYMGLHVVGVRDVRRGFDVLDRMLPTESGPFDVLVVMHEFVMGAGVQRKDAD